MRAGPLPAWLAAAALAVLLSAPLAAAHSQLRTSDPKAGARLDVAPAVVMVTMTEPVDPAGTSLTVTDSAGHRVDKDDLQIENGPTPTLHIHLQDHLPPGAYTINWGAFSGSDGHHTSGTVGFAVGAFTPPGSDAGSVNTLDPPAALSRALLYAGFSLAFGGAAFLAWLRKAGASEESARSAIAWGTAFHLAGTLLLTQSTVTATGISWGHLGGSAVGRVLLARLLFGAGAWVLAMLAQSRPTRTGPWAAVLLLLGAAIGSARLGHGSGDGPVTVALDLLHLVTASTWVGSLALLLWTLWQRRQEEPGLVRALGIRYGTLALACVVLLWASGAIVGLAVLGREAVLHPATTLASAYGAFLAAKMGLALLMVLLAGINRYVFLAPPSKVGLAGTMQRAARLASGGRIKPLELQAGELRSAVAIESAMGVAILVLAGFLTSVSPPSVEAGSAAPFLSQQGDSFVVHLQAQPDPQVGGTSMLTLVIEDAASGAPLVNNTCGRSTCVTVDLGYAGVNGTETHAAHQLGSSWGVHDLVWARAGEATVRVSISSAEVFHDEVTFHLMVAP